MSASSRRRFFFVLPVLIVLASGCARQEKRETARKAREPHPYFTVVRSSLKAYEGKTAEALEDLLKAAQIYPENAYLQYLLALRYVELRMWDNAARHVQQVLKSKPDWENANLLWAGILEARGDPEHAEKFYRKVFRSSSEEEEVLLQWVQNLVNQKKYRKAVAQIRLWLKKNPESLLALFYMATIQQVYMEDTDAAAGTYRQILKTDPDNAKARTQLVHIYLKEKKLEMALGELLKLEEGASQDLGLKLQIASLYQELGRIGEAINVLKSILEINPQADRIHYFLGLILEEQKEYAGALHHYGQVPPASGLYKDAVLRLANVLRALGRPGEAEPVLREALKGKNPDPAFYQFLSFIHEEKEDFNKALAILKEGVRKFPGDEELHFSLGVVYDKLDRREDAIRAMRRVVQINPKNASALNYIGYIYADRGENLEEAETLIRQALEIKPEDGFILDSLGWVFFQRGDLDNALKLIQRASKIAPDEPTVAEHLGDIYLKKGESGKALRFFRKAQALGEKKEKKRADELKRVAEKIRQLSGDY